MQRPLRLGHAARGRCHVAVWPPKCSETLTATMTLVRLFVDRTGRLSGLHCSATFIGGKKSQWVGSIFDCEYKGKLATPQRSCYFFFFFFPPSAFFGWPFPWCVKVSFYADRNENGTLALPLTPSLYMPPFHWVGPTNLNYGKTKNKGFIVQYVRL